MWWTVLLGIAPMLVVAYPTPGQQDPTIGTDGVVHAQYLDSLYAVNTDGSTKWIFKADGHLASHVEGLNGTVYVTSETAGSDPGTLFALDSTDGRIKWKHEVDENATVNTAHDGYKHLAMATDGTIYLASYVGEAGPTCHNTTINAIDTNGALRWTYTVARRGSLAAVSADGTLFVRTEASIDALRPDTGALKWSVALSRCVEATKTMAYAENGDVFLLQTQSEANCSNLAVSRLSSEDGSTLWKAALPGWYEHDGGVSHFLNLGSNNEVYVNGLNETGSCSLHVFGFDGNLLRKLPCLRGSTYYGNEKDVFVTVESTGGRDFDVAVGAISFVWAHAGSDGSLLWNVSCNDHLVWDGTYLVGPDMAEVRFGQDGTVFVWTHAQHPGTMGAQTHAIRNGEWAWSVEGSQQLMSEDGTTYVQGWTYIPYPTGGAHELQMVAVGADDEVKWKLLVDPRMETVAQFV